MRRRAEVFKWQGFWCVEIRTEHVGWTDVIKNVFDEWTDALTWAVRMVGA